MKPIKVKGDKALIRRLQKLPRSARNKILRPAIVSASKPVMRQAKANAKGAVGADSTRELEKSIAGRIRTSKRSVYAVIGPRTGINATRVNLFGKIVKHSPSKISHLVESGAKPHVIMIGRGRKTPWMHPGTPATKFMERAWASTSGQAQRIIETKVREGLAKHA